MSSPSMRWMGWLHLLAVVPLHGCYASNVVAVDDRAVAVDIMPTDWAAVTMDDVDGLFESVRIGGDAALSLRKIFYWFGSDGNYTGAALIESDDGTAFQTLVGTWSLSDGGLVLDGAEPVEFGQAADFLRMAAPGGELVLRRSEMQ